jgi:drug/metabolite transporter (DMT)-like permease
MNKTLAPEGSSVIPGLMMALIGFATYSTHDALVKSLSDYNVFQIVFFATLFGYVPFSIARIIEGKPASLKPVNPGLLTFRAVLHVACLSLAFFAFTRLPMVEAYVLLFCTPLLISILAIWFLNEKIAIVRWLAIFMGLVGVVIVLRPSPETISIGHAAAFGSAVCGAASAVISRKISASENIATMIIFPLLANILVAGSALYFVYQPMPLGDLAVMFLVGVLGLVGQYFVLRGYRGAPAAYVAPMQYSQIVWAILFGYVFFGETVDRWVLLGSSITIMSGVVIIWRERMVSKVQANLNTRNSRMVGAAMIQSIESETRDAEEILRK